MEENTLQLLKQEGWLEDQRIDIREAIQELEKRDYLILDSFIDFFQEFGNIQIECHVNGIQRYFNFFLDYIPEFEDSIIKLDYPQLIGCDSLNPIGYIGPEPFLVIDERGFIYSIYDGYIQLVGKDKYEALDNLCNKPWGIFQQQQTLITPLWW